MNSVGTGFRRSTEDVRLKWRTYSSVLKRRAAVLRREQQRTGCGSTSASPPHTTGGKSAGCPRRRGTGGSPRGHRCVWPQHRPQVWMPGHLKTNPSTSAVRDSLPSTCIWKLTEVHKCTKGDACFYTQKVDNNTLIPRSITSLCSLYTHRLFSSNRDVSNMQMTMWSMLYPLHCFWWEQNLKVQVQLQSL